MHQHDGRTGPVILRSSIRMAAEFSRPTVTKGIAVLIVRCLQW